MISVKISGKNCIKILKHKSSKRVRYTPKLQTMDVEEYTNKNGVNYLHMSKVPDICKSKPCVLGIDEAGRGPVLGPMVYGIAYCPVEKNSDLKELGVDDSKALKESEREALFEKLLEPEVADYVGWAFHVLSPRYISTSMFKRHKYNLNTVSHDTAIGLIHQAIKAGVRVAEVYVDTVGVPEKYQAKLEEIFPELKITVAKKADSLYPCVSAASICAKVARDKTVTDWIFPEASENGITFSKEWGSGYPGDPKTKQFLRDNIDRVFGYPTIVRFSWSTAEKLLEDKGCQVTFEEEEPEDDPQLVKNPSVKQFFNKSSTLNKTSNESGRVGKKRAIFFRDRNLKPSSIQSFLGIS